MKTEQRCVNTLRDVKDLPQKTAHGKEDALDRQDQSKYVDLELVDLKTDTPKPEKDFGPVAVLINDRKTGALRSTEPNHKLAIKTMTETEKNEDSGAGKCVKEDKDGSSNPTQPSVPQSTEKREDCLKSGDKSARPITQPGLSKQEEKDEEDAAREEELPCADSYLSEKSGSDDYDEDDDVSLVLSDDCVPCATEDESHYITTHEIQLSELSDHERDYDLGVGSSTGWDTEDDNRVYSFVDYASFDGDGAVGQRGDRRQACSQGAAAVSTLRESDPCDAAKFTSSDESVPRIQQQQCSANGGGQIRLSIRTTSRAINDPSNVQEQGNILYHARRSGDMSRYVLRGVDGKAERLCDRANCFIAAPGRLHFGGKLRGKEVTGYSSGASSAVSESDDADKEVRNLTARAFKSLAHPYFEAINFSNSSESSASEYGLGINRWSTFVDLKYGNLNMSRGLDQSVVSHQNKAALEIAKNFDNRGVALASIKPANSKIFTLNGSPHSASSATKQIELMGKIGQGHSGVIRLTETLNFRCNVKPGMPGEERRTNFAQNATGSHSADEVTHNLPSAQRRGGSKPPSKTMEDTHKKAIFASSVIKNVISKKMQFEQERKMERGEIREPHRASSPCFVHQESDCQRGKGSREVHRQSSRFSESSSDYAIMCVDELGDIVDSGSCDAMNDCRRQDTSAPAPETNLEPTNEGGIDAKKGALDASKSTLSRSQNSAFRCWKDEELEFQKDHKNGKTLQDKAPSTNDKAGEGDQCAAGRGKLTKMSHLFVPSIQLLPSNVEVGKQLQSRNYSPCGDGSGVKMRSDNTFFVADSKTVSTSKSPEFKINLRSARDNKTEPFGVSKLRAPNIGCNAASLIRTDDFKCQALAAALKGESSDKVPHFMVRDIRDNKGKLQTPIHQVRDVRKLVKSSYPFASLESNENKSNVASGEQRKQMSYRNLNSVSPIVIKCQSVNTNSNGKQFENFEVCKQEQLDMDRSSPEGAKSAALQRAAGRADTSVSSNVSEGGFGVRMEGQITSKKEEKLSDTIDKKPESKVANQVALEKLQAAVKTMEQLYVFEKNEWKRRNDPQPLTDSHVLSLLASEEHGRPEEEGAHGPIDKTVRRDSNPNTDKTPPVVAMSSGTDSLQRWEEKDPLRTLQASSGHDDRLVDKSVQNTRTTDSNIMSSLSSSFTAATTAKTQQPNISTQTPLSSKTLVPKSPKLPVSLKISQTRLRREGAESKEVNRSVQELSSTLADNENYLTIPVKSRASSSKQPPSADKITVHTVTTQSQPTTPPGLLGYSTRAREDLSQTPKRSSIVMDTCPSDVPPATIYHSLPLGISTNQPQVYCFSPAITPAPNLDPFLATQRKMLLDPTTGNYYLVDTPVQPTTKRLFDPETGQYVDVPIPQPPMTPVPMPISPLALSPGAYGHTYMIYPGFMPAPSLIPARTLVQTQMSVQSDMESLEKASAQQTEAVYMESPFYMATGKSPQGASRVQQPAATNRLPQAFSSIKQPVISITSQQGPRIIAPPSFDGTTMSFVVEHR